MGLTDIFKRNNNPQPVLDQENGYVGSVIFGRYLLSNSASTLSAFFGARELICNSIAQLPILIKLNDEIDRSHVLNLVFKSGLMPKFNLMKQLILDIIDFGNAICYIKRSQDGTPTGLVYCEHGSYNIHYQQSTQDLYYTIPFISSKKVLPKDVLHLYKNSNNGVEGKSISVYANQILTLAKSADKAASDYYASGCSVKGALTIKGSRRDSKEKARQAFADVHGGYSSSGLIILDDDMSYQALSSHANDSQLLETRLFNVAEISRFFNISPILLGDLSHTSYNDIEAANLEFIQHTLLPYIRIIEDEFSRKLLKPEEYDYSIDLDENYLLRGNKNTTANYLSKLVMNGIMTGNEARKQLGLPAVEGADELRIAYSDITQNNLNQNEKEEGNSEEDGIDSVENSESDDK